MSAEQDLANANVQIANLISEVTRFRDAAMGINNIWPTITEGRQNTADGKYFSVPGSGTYMRLYRRQGSSAQLIAEFPDRAQVQSLVDTLGGRGVVGGSGDLMAQGAFGLGGFENYTSSVEFDSLEASFSQFFRLPTTPESPFGSAGSGFRGQFAADGRAIDVFVGTSVKGMYYRRRVSAESQWEAPVRVYDADNVIGDTASGAIIQRGANANGRFFKFAGGLLLCETVIDLGSSGFLNEVGGFYRPDAEVEWVFPSAYASSPCVNATINRPNIGISGFVSIYTGPSNSSVNLLPWLSHPGNGARRILVSALGVWN